MCQRYYCNFCLKGNYEINVDLIKSKKEWICPWCEVLIIHLTKNLNRVLAFAQDAREMTNFLS
jgi:hypothetical protein